MTHFFITDDTRAKKHAISSISRLPNATIAEARLSDNTEIVYNSQQTTYLQFEDVDVWGFGTFFNNNGFHENALEPITEIKDLFNTLRQSLRGHYVFVISSNSGVRIIPDKIGLLNIFYSNNKNRYISTDPALISICASNVKLSGHEVKEFILNESSVGRQTIFKDTMRLAFGNEIKLADRTLTDRPFYTYSLDKLTFKQYMQRISEYFEQINAYEKTIATDISAGFDTRTVAAVGSKTIDNLLQSSVIEPRFSNSNSLMDNNFGNSIG